ncbi:MAG: ribosome maturation factor RimM [Erysipelotrichales bacterium]|nr:ribosome maturation factor RimM [Erysipelotrichales bacterium]
MKRVEYIEIGKIVNTFGIRGEVKIKPFTDFDRFAKNKRIYVSYQDKYHEEIIATSRVQKGIYYVSFKNYDNINQVIKYKDALCYITELDQEKLPEGEYYFHQLVGLKIYNRKNILRGTVRKVLEYPLSAYLEVSISDNKTKLIPFISHFIDSVDEEKIIINEIEGLL